MMTAYMNAPKEADAMSDNRQTIATMKYKAKALKRIPFEVRKEYYEAVIKNIPRLTGMSVNGFIKAAIIEKIERDGLDLPIDQYNP